MKNGDQSDSVLSGQPGTLNKFLMTAISQSKQITLLPSSKNINNFSAHTGNYIWCVMCGSQKKRYRYFIHLHQREFNFSFLEPGLLTSLNTIY